MINRAYVVSHAIPEIVTKLNGLGFITIDTDSIDCFIDYERKHADMQCINIDGKVFVIKSCCHLIEQLMSYNIKPVLCDDYIDEKYPHNIRLNAKVIGNNIVGKAEYLSTKLIKYCNEHNYNIINVNQGYSSCSCVAVSDSSVITADESIRRELIKQGIDVLKITPGHIKLHDARSDTYGFIGGACTMINNNNLLFFGDITKHPDYIRIYEFCNNKNVLISYIDNIPLTDIGGAILLNI